MRVFGIVLFAGVVSTGMGIVLLWISDSVEGICWIGVGVTAGGMILLGMALRSRRRPSVDDEYVSDVAPERNALPGPWYPWAIIGIGLALGIWLTIGMRR